MEDALYLPVKETPATDSRSESADRCKRLLEICKLLDDIDCCVGYSIADNDLPKFWEAQEKARELLGSGGKPHDCSADDVCPTGECLPDV